MILFISMIFLENRGVNPEKFYFSFNIYCTRVSTKHFSCHHLQCVIKCMQKFLNMQICMWTMFTMRLNKFKKHLKIPTLFDCSLAWRFHNVLSKRVRNTHVLNEDSVAIFLKSFILWTSNQGAFLDRLEIRTRRVQKNEVSDLVTDAIDDSVFMRFLAFFS